jgi:hypothetical protein
MKNKVTKRSVYILTEGQTEYAYFSRIGEIMGLETEYVYSVKVEVREIVEGSKQDPVNIVREAKKSKKDYDEVWVVFDKDRDRDEEIEVAYKIAAKAKIQIAISSISFEHWLILHFEKCAIAFQRSDCESRSTHAAPVNCICNGNICAKTYLKQPALFPTFEKGRSLLYDDLKDRNEIAVENAAWLRKNQQPYTHIHLLNPYTDVDNLLCELLELKKVTYVSAGETIAFDDVEITILNASRNGDSVTVIIQLNNLGQLAFPINNNRPFIVIDNGGNTFQYKAIEASLLLPNDFQSLTLNYTVNLGSQGLYFKATASHSCFFVEI